LFAEPCACFLRNPTIAKIKAGAVKNSPHSSNRRDSGQGANVVPLAPVFSGTLDDSSAQFYCHSPHFRFFTSFHDFLSAGANTPWL
jgi:hypothetical protein